MTVDASPVLISAPTQRTLDGLMAFPSILLAIAILGALLLGALFVSAFA